MKNDDVFRLADQAGIIPWEHHEWQHGTLIHIDDGMDGDVACLLQFAQLVAAAEREKWVKEPLTDEQIDKLAHDLWMGEKYWPIRTFARAIERAHGIGGEK